MSKEIDITKVDLVTVVRWPFSRCRGCNQKMVWFNVQLDQETRIPFIAYHQNPANENKAFCPYCGKQQLYAEDGSCQRKK